MESSDSFVWPKNYYGMANKLSKSDSRLPEMIASLQEDGFDETELWDLKSTMLSFSIPRLKAFAQNLGSRPSELRNEINFIVEVFERHLANSDSPKSIEYTYSPERVREITDAWIRLANIMPALWI